MKKKSNYTTRKQHDLLEKQNKTTNVHNSKYFEKSDRIEWLKQLYAEWLEKRNSILNCNEETYLFNEPYELDIKTYL